jgi:hypothetical protein
MYDLPPEWNDFYWEGDEEELEMAKEQNYIVASSYYETYADAELSAKRYAAKQNCDYPIYKKVAVAKAVVPAIEVEQVTVA